MRKVFGAVFAGMLASCGSIVSEETVRDALDVHNALANAEIVASGIVRSECLDKMELYAADPNGKARAAELDKRCRPLVDAYTSERTARLLLLDAIQRAKKGTITLGEFLHLLNDFTEAALLLEKELGK